MKLQSDYNKSLKQQQSKNAPVQMAASAPTPAPASSDENPSAAQLDSKRLAAGQTTTITQPAPAIVQPVVETAAPAPAPAPVVHEGDVIEFTDLDSPPQIVNAVKPEYPRLAKQQKLSATVVVSALISETGQVLEVKVLKGEERFGFNDAAIRAMRATRFSPAIKDGKRVKTWRPQAFTFIL